MRENVDQNNSKYGHFSSSVAVKNFLRNTYCNHHTELVQNCSLDIPTASFFFVSDTVKISDDDIPRSVQDSLRLSFFD